MSEDFYGSVTAVRAGKRWIILAIGMPSVNCPPAGATDPLRLEGSR